ncbi:MAG: AIM24 family protein [Methanomicrobiales archaeon]
MQYTILGDNLQMVRIHLDAGEMVRAEAGAMVNMSENMTMESEMTGGSSGGSSGSSPGRVSF